jgi:hypothetical protein
MTGKTEIVPKGFTPERRVKWCEGESRKRKVLADRIACDFIQSVE